MRPHGAEMGAKAGPFGPGFRRIEPRFQRIAIALRRARAGGLLRLFNGFTPRSVTLIVFQNFSAGPRAGGQPMARAGAALKLGDDLFGFGKADRFHAGLYGCAGRVVDNETVGKFGAPSASLRFGTPQQGRGRPFLQIGRWMRAKARTLLLSRSPTRRLAE